MLLTNENGQSFRLLKPLTRAGGEGQIYEIAGTTSTVAKLYNHFPDAIKIAKLRHQVQMPRTNLHAVSAWPTGLLFDPSRPNLIRGILMARVCGKEIHKLYGPSDRASDFPKAGWDFLIHTAINCAAAFETIHQHGVVMADVNEGNLLVDERDGRVALVDCDSYQISKASNYFPCDVGVPMWTPPELQGLNFRGLTRTPNHDRFGLAVLIFRLLFMGRHPYAGIPTGSEQFEIAEAIKRFLFAFSPKSWSSGVNQPPHSLTLNALPARISGLFERAFLSDSIKQDARPTGREWANELRILLSSLRRTCLDPGHQHWSGLSVCPWCAIIGSGGPNFFVSIAIHVGSADWTAEFNNLWKIIDRITSGTLMREKVSPPPQQPLAGRSMPCTKPTQSRTNPPTPPKKPAPITKRTIPPPQYPPPPVLRAPILIPNRLTGINQQMAEHGATAAAIFSTLFLLFEISGLKIAKVGAFLAGSICILYTAVKWRRAQHEARLNEAIESEEKAEAHRKAEEIYKTESATYQTLIGNIDRQRLIETEIINAEHEQDCQRIEQSYQLQLNSYLAAKRSYDAEQEKYNTSLQLWETEVRRRKTHETNCRLALTTLVENINLLLTNFQASVRKRVPPLVSARKRFEESRIAELADLRQLNNRRMEVQLKQHLLQHLIRDADIPGIGKSRKATLAAYNISSAADITDNLQVPGIGVVFLGKLKSWRRQCEAKFSYRAGARLPIAEVNAVKLKHAQPRQSSLLELRAGAKELEDLESATMSALTNAKRDLQDCSLVHAQAMADLEVCK